MTWEAVASTALGSDVVDGVSKGENETLLQRVAAFAAALEPAAVLPQLPQLPPQLYAGDHDPVFYTRQFRDHGCQTGCHETPCAVS